MSALLIWDKLPPFRKRKTCLKRVWNDFFTPFFCSIVNRRNLRRYFPSSSPFLLASVQWPNWYANAARPTAAQERNTKETEVDRKSTVLSRGERCEVNWGGCDVILSPCSSHAYLTIGREKRKERRYTYTRRKSDFGWFTPLAVHPLPIPIYKYISVDRCLPLIQKPTRKSKLSMQYISSQNSCACMLCLLVSPLDLFSITISRESPTRLDRHLSLSLSIASSQSI